MFLYKRGSIWYVGWREDGKQKGKALHKLVGLPFPIRDKTTARNFLIRLQNQMIDQKLGKVPESTLSIDDFYLEYQRFCDRNKAKSTVYPDRYRLKRWLDFLKGQKIKSIGEISKSTLNRFLSSLQGSNATLNRYISLIHASLRWGVRQGYLKDDPLRGFSRLSEPRPTRPAQINSEDLEKLFSIPDRKFRLFLQLIYYTVARKGEVLALTWEDIDLKKRLIYFRQTKTKIPRTIPICEDLYNLLQPLSPKRGKLFVWQRDYVSRKFQRLRKKLNLKIAGIHQFRHARASELLQKGANPKAVQALLGHKTSKTTMDIYAQISLDGLKEIVSKL